MKIQYNRNRYYDYYTGRWLTHDPLGIVPHSRASNYFLPGDQYSMGLSLYEYLSSTPTMATDPWGLEIFDDLLNFNYKLGTDAPEDGDWKHGGWNSLGPLASLPPMPEVLDSIQTRAYTTAQLMTPLFPDARRHLLHYLSNTGDKLTINYIIMLRDSEMARKSWKTSLKRAMQYAEKVAAPDVLKPIVQKGHSYEQVFDDMNWRLAIQTYYTWGRGKVTKGKGRRSCCYYMDWTLHMRDNYEFENAFGILHWGGLVFDGELNWLNLFGRARHFKIRGSRGIRITWAKGYRLEKDNARDLIEGKKKPFPQCY